jgi:hypothetical protein
MSSVCVYALPFNLLEGTEEDQRNLVKIANSLAEIRTSISHRTNLVGREIGN